MTHDDVPWLTPDERRAWLGVVAVMELLPAALDKQLQRDADLTLFDYMVIAILSETPDRTRRMSALASATNATLPRLSHVVSRLEKRGLVSRCTSTDDRRATDVRLTDAGMAHIVDAAPEHVRTARRFVLDALTPEQIGQLEDITRSMLTRLDPEMRFGSWARAAAEADDAACPGIGFRAATPDDEPLLRAATLDAMNWDGDRFDDDALDRPEFAHYFRGFDGVRDRGVLATDADGPVGAAWVRFLPRGDQGYGFVADDVPELTLAVDARARGRGLGTELLTRLLAVGCDAGWRGVSLSVEDGNAGARALYERAGFRTVGRNGDSDTMLLELR
jgi:DNA-binding MarR family transcriptional regulator/GNAT superfamily N-acetyltransferase